jgi:hypothetical protein
VRDAGYKAYVDFCAERNIAPVPYAEYGYHFWLEGRVDVAPDESTLFQHNLGSPIWYPEKAEEA